MPSTEVTATSAQTKWWSAVAHHAYRLDQEQHREGLPDRAAKASIATGVQAE